MADDGVIIDRPLLLRRRARFAPVAEAHDFLARRTAEDMATRLDAVIRDFPLAVDLGAQHGLLAGMLHSQRVGRTICAEASLPLLGRCPRPKLACHEELLPFAPRSLDLVVSCLSLHLLNDLPGALIQIRRALKPDGLLLAAAFGGRTLQELRESFTAAQAELDGGVSPHVLPFADVRDYGALLQRAGFALPVTDSDVVSVTYPTPLELMAEVRAMGGGNVLRDRSRKPLRRATLLRTVEIYRQRFGTDGGRVAATFEIVHLMGWAPHEGQQKPLRPGSARTRLADALGVRERSAGVKADPGERPGKANAADPRRSS